MPTRLCALMLALALLIAPAAAAAPLSLTREAQRDVMVTIYNGNLGLVKEVREARLPAGILQVQFRDVAARIDPTTVHLRSLTDPAGVAILEQNYEYDLLSSQKLMEKYVGRTVRLSQADGTWHDARLLTTSGPVFEINGQIHIGHHGRLVLPSLPDNLVAAPTLVWLLRNRAVTPQRVESSYLTGGITWRADYVLVLDAADTRSDLTGWVTIDNTSGATSADAALKLVAGDVNRAQEGRRAGAMMEIAAKSPSARDAARAFAAEGFFEYHLYTLDGRTTLKDQQTKQADASGSQQFIGEDWIDHTPKDERVSITLGHAFDVVGERTQKDWRSLASGLYEVEWEIALRNHKDAAQTVTVIEPVPGDWDVLRATHAWDKPQAHTLRFEVPVPAQGAARVVYRVRLRLEPAARRRGRARGPATRSAGGRASGAKRTRGASTPKMLARRRLR